LNMTSHRNSNLRQAFQVLDLRGDHDIDVLGPTHYPPSIHSEPSDDDELHLGVSQALQQLVEGRCAQLLRAEPVNCISL